MTKKLIVNQDLTIRIGADRIGNDCTDRKIARTDNSLLINAKIRRSRVTRDSGK